MKKIGLIFVLLSVFLTDCIAQNQRVRDLQSQTTANNNYLFLVDAGGWTRAKKMTLSTVTSLEAALRTVSDSLTRQGAGLNTSTGAYVVLTGSNYLKTTDFSAIGLTANQNNAMFILDSILNDLLAGTGCHSLCLDSIYTSGSVYVGGNIITDSTVLASILQSNMLMIIDSSTNIILHCDEDSVIINDDVTIRGNVTMLYDKILNVQDIVGEVDDFSVGDTGQGGIVFITPNNPLNTTGNYFEGAYVDAGQHFLSDVLLASGAVSNAIGQGANNTTLFVTQPGFTNGAVMLCDTSTYGGYTDWFLPSLFELSQLYINNAYFDTFLYAGYWSSTEYNATLGKSISFVNGTTSNSNKMLSPFGVRCIRSFSLNETKLNLSAVDVNAIGTVNYSVKNVTTSDTCPQLFGNVMFLDYSGTLNIVGFVGGSNGTVLNIVNKQTGNNVVINNSSTVPTGAHPIHTGTGGNVTITNEGGATFVFDGSTWYLTGVNQ